ncbi:MAG TPA: GNAT family N-acetyltransferase [Acidimicrobiales bacterium]|nr:GNAT family N-acetyltransferase [Acidimicrobiales bacterium]
MTTAVVRAPESEDEWRQCHRIAAQGFNGPLTPAAEEEQLPKFHRDRCLAVVVGDEVAAWSQVRPFGQFFGGRRVPMGGFSPVVTAPEHRGQGFGSRVTAAQLPIMRDRGEVIAGLYPAQTQLYRGNGFEVAGVFAGRTLPTRSLHHLRPSASVRLRAGTADDLAAVKGCYARFAMTQNGWLDRPDVWWDNIVPGDKIGREQFLYVADGEGGALAGYVRYAHAKARPPALGYTIQVMDFCAAEPDVALALWRMIGTSSTQAEHVRISGAVEHPLLLLLPDQDLKTTDEIRWMLRVVDAPRAIAARGYPAAVRATVDLDLADRQCEWNAGRWRLTVEDGSATLDKGGDGDVQLTSNAFSALYSGYAAAGTLRRTGLISSGDTRSLSALEAVFAGPTPSIADFY